MRPTCPGARVEAASAGKTPVGLTNGEQLVKLFVEYDILVQRTSYDLLELPLRRVGGIRGGGIIGPQT